MVKSTQGPASSAKHLGDDPRYIIVDDGPSFLEELHHEALTVLNREILSTEDIGPESLEAVTQAFHNYNKNIRTNSQAKLFDREIPNFARKLIEFLRIKIDDEDKIQNLILNSKFDPNLKYIYNIYSLEYKKARYIEFVTELFGFDKEQAEHAYEQTLRLSFTRAAGRETFAARATDEDAITFYTRVWVQDLLSGAANRFDVLNNDPSLIAAVRNRANYLARKKGGDGPDYYPEAYPPPEPQISSEAQALREQSVIRNRRYRAGKSDPQP